MSQLFAVQAVASRDKNGVRLKTSRLTTSLKKDAVFFLCRVRSLSLVNSHHVLFFMHFRCTRFNFHHEFPEWRNHSRLRTQMALIKKSAVIWTRSDASSVNKLSFSSSSRVKAGLGNTKTATGMACLTKWGHRDNEDSIIKGSDQDLFAYEFRSSLVARKWG